MLITITMFSILIVSALVWLANRILSLAVCPVCAGVFLTWVGLTVAHFLGYQMDLEIPALLMGGSVVGIAYQLEKKSRNLSADAMFLWKTVFILVGFIAAYGILEELWAVFLIAITLLLLLSQLLVGSAGTRREAASDLEKKMEGCC